MDAMISHFVLRVRAESVPCLKSRNVCGHSSGSVTMLIMLLRVGLSCVVMNLFECVCVCVLYLLAMLPPRAAV